MERLALGARDFAKFFGLTQRAHRLVGYLFAQRREAHDSASPLDEGYTKDAFELAQTRGEGRLRHIAGVGGLTEMPVLVQRDEVLQLLESRQIFGHWHSRSMASE
jgi:hypothetical protein